METGDAAETVYHSDDVAHVTSERVTFGAHSYELAALRSARVIAEQAPKEEQPSDWQQLVGYVGAAIYFVRVIMAISRPPVSSIVSFALLALAVGRVIRHAFRIGRGRPSGTNYIIQLRPSDRSAADVEVYASADAHYADRLAAAVNRAIRENRPVGEPKGRKDRKRRKRKRPRAPRAKGALNKRR